MKQFEMHHIFSGLQRQVRTPNIYLTVILVHALHVQLSLVHRALAKGTPLQDGTTKRMISLQTPYITALTF
jgi:hypothetical protein